MSSILVGELKSHLEEYPDDYEVIMEIASREKNHLGDYEDKISIAFINGIRAENDYREVRLMNQITKIIWSVIRAVSEAALSRLSDGGSTHTDYVDFLNLDIDTTILPPFYNTLSPF